MRKDFSKSRFSRRRLLIFALAFGAIGGYVIYRSFAAPNPNLPGDLNGDNIVSIADLSTLLNNFGTTNSIADINLDGQVTILDLSILLGHYGQSYTPPPPPSVTCDKYASTSGSDSNAGSVSA